jgi:KDO2-lipid IV(A) lauroyltransferase
MKIFYMYCDDPQLYDRDIEIATTALNKAVENMINRFPTEYMWGYKRFRAEPISKDYYK